MNIIAFSCSIVSAFIIGVTLSGAAEAFDRYHQYGKEAEYRRGLRNFVMLLLGIFGIGASFMGLMLY